MADYNNEHNTYLPAKGISIKNSGSKGFEGSPIFENGEKVSGSALCIDYRMDTETSTQLLTALISLFPETAKTIISSVSGTNNELASANGTKLSIHVGSRKSAQGGRVFNAGIGFLKPLQNAPGRSATKRSNVSAMKKAVGDVEDPSSFK